jgi:hypothetical protein
LTPKIPFHCGTKFVQKHIIASNTRTTMGDSLCGLDIYIKKYLKKAKDKLWKLKYFSMKKYNLQRNPLK